MLIQQKYLMRNLNAKKRSTQEGDSGTKELKLCLNAFSVPDWNAGLSPIFVFLNLNSLIQTLVAGPRQTNFTALQQIGHRTSSGGQTLMTRNTNSTVDQKI